MNRPAQEVALMEAAEDLVDEFLRWSTAYAARLKAHVTALDDHRQQRQIVRALDRVGVDSEWARRELALRRKGGTPDPEAA